MKPTPPPSNFTFLQVHDPQLARLGLLAERYFAADPNTCLLKLRQFGEVLAQLAAARTGLYTSPQETQADLLYRLRDENVTPGEVYQLFGELRRTGNAAVHALADDHRSALAMLKLAWQLGVWFHRTFADPNFKSGPFVPPAAPEAQAAETADAAALRAELARLNTALAVYEAQHGTLMQQMSAREQQLRAEFAAALQAAQDEGAFWAQLAAATEAAKVELAQRLAAQQAAAAAGGPAARQGYVAAAGAAAQHVDLDEAATRKLIDAQLRAAGWEADSGGLRYATGARPQKGRNLAIAEWPTLNGPADYVLFAGLAPLAVVEAKRRHTEVASTLQQAKRYSRGFANFGGGESPGGPWPGSREDAPAGVPATTNRIPFAFATNGRPFLRQLQSRSGIWFCDLRRPDNLSRPLSAWYTPAGLLDLLRRDTAQADARLAAAPVAYDFALRPYQVEAIRAVETAIAGGSRVLLLAMATGTGKTKVAIALIYRLLRTQRFRRVLFLVDRAALGEQAANAFKDTRMENLQTFADIFGIQELDTRTPATETSVHIATVQGMVQRLLYSGDDAPPPVDQYDCIVVDECHRGYLLDRELSNAELTFRGYDDYISKYRRVIEHFDAVKIGLTATPALHTVEIFGRPVYTYSYRDAVIDGYLVDHEPPIQLTTYLAAHGITWAAGEQVQVYHPEDGHIDLVTAPDTITIEIDGFNRRVIAESFNRVVCEYLATELDPLSREKTLIFCVNDAHADDVVRLLKDAFAGRYGSVEDDAVLKITGSADKPLQLIRRLKNEHFPTVAVTVDLLTTGIDVPEICTLVFLRRVNSRILFDQMLGRATRLCPELGKEAFRIIDAVQLYAALQGLTDMQPVVANPAISFAQLVHELGTVRGDAERQEVLDQFLAKFQRKKRTLSAEAAQELEDAAGMAPDQLVAHLRGLPLDAVAAWFTANPDLGELLDRRAAARPDPLLISEHADQLLRAERGYGSASQPEDYLRAFELYVNTHRDTLPALAAVLARPASLTRKQLRELAAALDAAGYSETNLTVAWRAVTNQEIAAHIVGYIRKAARADEALLPFDQRVDRALNSILAGGTWSTPQRQWLQRIAAQTKANGIVDREALDAPDQIFRREGGGYERLNRLFDGQLPVVLARFNETIWLPYAA
jgi:type I restriction enzyme R subunit